MTRFLVRLERYYSSIPDELLSVFVTVVWYLIVAAWCFLALWKLRWSTTAITC